MNFWLACKIILNQLSALLQHLPVNRLNHQRIGYNIRNHNEVYHILTHHVFKLHVFKVRLHLGVLRHPQP